MQKRYAKTVGIVAAAAGGLALNGAAFAVGVAASTVQPSNWYRADALLGFDAAGAPLTPADGTFFSRWVDVSGNDRHTGQLTSTRRPTFRTDVAGSTGTLPAVRFNLNLDKGGTSGGTSSEHLYFNGVIANTPESKLTMFVVSRDSGDRTTGAVRSGLVSTRSGGTNGGFTFGNGANATTGSYFHASHSSSAGGTQTVAQGGAEFALTTLSRDALTTTLGRYGNLGSNVTTATWGGTRTIPATSTTPYAGQTFTGFTPSVLALANAAPVTQIGTENGGSYFYGDMAEILIYDGTLLGDRDRRIITNYLGEKYGIASADLTQLGDANGDFQTNFADLVRLAQNYNVASGQTVSTGDFNNDGAVNFADLVILAQNYNTGSDPVAPPPSISASFAADWAMAQALVPEPTALAGLGAVLGLLVRRRAR